MGPMRRQVSFLVILAVGGLLSVGAFFMVQGAETDREKSDFERRAGQQIFFLEAWKKEYPSSSRRSTPSLSTMRRPFSVTAL